MTNEVYYKGELIPNFNQKLIDEYNIKNYHEVYYKGKLIATLNRQLIDNSNMGIETLSVLRESYVTKHILFEQAKKTKDSRKLRALAAVFEELEDRQQMLWGFRIDRSYHKWFTFPGCTCPKMDNNERRGVKDAGRIIDAGCKVHGIRK